MVYEFTRLDKNLHAIMDPIRKKILFGLNATLHTTGKLMQNTPPPYAQSLFQCPAYFCNFFASVSDKLNSQSQVTGAF